MSLLLVFVVLTMLVPVNAVSNPKLAAFSVGFEDTSNVDEKTRLRLDFTKYSDSNTWLDFYCFEIVFRADYKGKGQ